MNTAHRHLWPTCLYRERAQQHGDHGQPYLGCFCGVSMTLSRLGLGALLLILSSQLLSGADNDPVSEQIEAIHHVRPQVAALVREAIAKGVLLEGPEVEGLTLSAMALLERPQQDRALPVLMAISNRSPHSMAIPLQMWTARAHPAGRTRHGIMRTISADWRVQPFDFLEIPPGGQQLLIMDVSLVEGAHDSPAITVTLDIPCPRSARQRPDGLPQHIFSGLDELISGPVTIDARLPLTSSSPTDLRASDPQQRAAAIRKRCADRRPDDAEAILRSIATWGPSQASGGGLAPALTDYAQGLPADQALEWLHRASIACDWNWRDAFALISPFTTGGTPAQRALAAQVFARYLPRSRQAGDWELAIFCYSIIYKAWGRVEAWRSMEEAQALLAQVTGLKPEDPQVRLLNAVIGLTPINDALIAAASPQQLNSMAWNIIQATAPEQARLWALAMIRHAVARQQSSSLVDTLVATLIANGLYAEAHDAANDMARRYPDDTRAGLWQHNARALTLMGAEEALVFVETLDYDHPIPLPSPPSSED